MISVLATNPAEQSSAVTIATVIIGVSAYTALLAWMMWRAVKSVERAERDPKYLRRRLFLVGIVYVVAAAIGIVEVATGREPIQTLIGLPIGLLFAWAFLRAAIKVKAPPT